MYSQYSGYSSTHDNSFTTSLRLNSPNINKYDSTSYLPASKDAPSRNWNIEGSKENYALRNDRPVTSAHINYDREKFSCYPDKESNVRKDYHQTLQDYSKSKMSKSHKSIKFSNDTEIQSPFSKDYSKTMDDDFKKLKAKKDNLKSITMSLNHKSTLKDLLPNFRVEDYKVTQAEKPARALKSCKSELRIRMDSEDTPAKTMKDIPKSPTDLIKSYKKIADYMNENTFSRKEQTEISTFKPSNKSTKYIREEPIRQKVQKVVSYNQHLNQDVGYKVKKHHTVDFSRPAMVKQCSVKAKVSINDFQLGKCSGQGAFGQVFPAIHKTTRMLVAIKKVPKEKVKYMLEQFVTQIKIQMFLNHPNIVQLYGFFDDLTNFYIIMEYMEGGSLFNLIKKKKKIPEAETIERLKDICLGLKEMHDNSILHRDIKPENIVITNDVCKLCDLGWAAICKDRRNTYCGTLDYVSPQIIGGQGYDDSVDIWCVGVLTYEMICGKTPFYNISRKQTMKKIVDVNYEYPAQLTPKSRAFIDRILKKNPDNRIGIDEILKDKFLL